MRLLSIVLVVATLIGGPAMAAQADPKSGVEYVMLKAPQPVAAAGKKVEVLEFFMYHCPHCNALEPSLEEWIKKQGDKIVFHRIHVPYQPTNDPEAHLFLTLEAMGKAEEMQMKVFKAFHVEHKRLTSDEAVLEWAPQAGLDRAAFLDAWNSFGVATKLRNLPHLIDNYGIEYVPTIIIDGKYKTAPSIVQEADKISGEPQIFAATLQVMDALVAKAAATK